jgi:hypothetical protein
MSNCTYILIIFFSHVVSYMSLYIASLVSTSVVKVVWLLRSIFRLISFETKNSSTDVVFWYCFYCNMWHQFMKNFKASTFHFISFMLHRLSLVLSAPKKNWTEDKNVKKMYKLSTSQKKGVIVKSVYRLTFWLHVVLHIHCLHNINMLTQSILLRRSDLG